MSSTRNVQSSSEHHGPSIHEFALPRTTTASKRLEIDCTSLLTHLQLLEKSLPHLNGPSSTLPSLEMMGLPRATLVALNHPQTAHLHLNTPLSSSSSFGGASSVSSDGDNDVQVSPKKKSSKSKSKLNPFRKKSSNSKSDTQSDLGQTVHGSPIRVVRRKRRGKRKNKKNALEHLDEWYILVAYTQHAVSAQLVHVPGSYIEGLNDSMKGEDEDLNPVVPNLTRYTPLRVWTSLASSAPSAASMQPESNSSLPMGIETISCSIRILVQKPSLSLLAHESECLKVAILFGTSHSRLLAQQLSLQSVTIMDEGERFVLFKAPSGENSIEPLPLDRSMEENNGSSTVGGDSSTINRRRGRGDSLSASHHRSMNSSVHGGGGTNASDVHTVGSGTNTARSSTKNESQSHATKSNKTPKVFEAFNPKGGVVSIGPNYHTGNGPYNPPLSSYTTMSVDYLDGAQDFCWIAYKDGTMVRLPRFACFPISLEDIQLVLRTSNGVVDTNDLNPVSALVKAHTWIQKDKNSDDSKLLDAGVTLPLPFWHPSLLSQPLEIASSVPTLAPSPTHHNAEADTSLERGEYVLDQHEFYEAIKYAQPPLPNSVNQGSSESSLVPLPTLSFFTNEDQEYSRTHVLAQQVDSPTVTSTVESLFRNGTSLIGGTAAIAKGMFGGVRSVFHRQPSQRTKMKSGGGSYIGNGSAFDLQSTTSRDDGSLVPGMEIGGMGEGGSILTGLGSSSMIVGNGVAELFPSVHEESTSLPLRGAILDSPRKIIAAAIDPVQGTLLACADNLGRVQLIDLTTRQVVRMWKGLREASCHWIQFPVELERGVRLLRYLVIHSQQRQVIEIYRVSQGPRVARWDVSKWGSDVKMVSCSVAQLGTNATSKCFLLQSSSKKESKYIVRELTIHDKELMDSVNLLNEGISKGTMALNPVNPLSRGDIISDEGTLHLQLLKQLLSSEIHISSDLDAVFAALTQVTAISDLCQALDLLATSTHLESGLGVKDSSFHSDVVAHAVEQLETVMRDEAIATSTNPLLKELSDKICVHKQLIASYDVLHKFESGKHNDNDNDDSYPKSIWVQEAILWIKTYEDVTGHSIDNILTTSGPQPKLFFSTFAKSCLQDRKGSKLEKGEGSLNIYLCESTRDRKKILYHLFRPLLKDVFIFNTTQRIFENMGIHKDYDKLLQYFGEWFMSLPGKEAAHASLGDWCPMVRWLQNIIQGCLEQMKPDETSEKILKVPLLGKLHQFCSEASDLPRAFLLAVVCCDAISATTKVVENQSYGLISHDKCVKPWEELLRKLRMCLLISLRLGLHSHSAVPLTIAHVEEGDLFSIFEWIARDELTITQSSEILHLEESCKTSQISFDLCSKDGDDLSRWKMVQKSCHQNSVKTCPNNLESPGPLLFFLRHYNNSVILAAHRALILALRWGQDPKSIELLDATMSTIRFLKALSDGHQKIFDAIVLEIWNTQIRPIYCAILFGFEMTHELNEEIVAPLLQESGWFYGVNKIALEMFLLLETSVDRETEDSTLEVVESTRWPPLQEDFVMKRHLKQASVPLNKISLEVHKGVICAIQLSDDLRMLPQCVPSYESLFSKGSLHEQYSPNPEANEYQIDFLKSCTFRKATISIGPVIVEDDLEELVSLGRSWGIEKSHVFSLFLLSMYKIGKDDIIEDLFLRSSRLLDVSTFLAGAMPLVCVRLNAAVTMLRKTRQCRSILAMLDADTCEWVKEQAEAEAKEESIMEGDMVPLESTHSLITRMIRMNAVNKIDAYALNGMCGTLVKASEKYQEYLKK